MHCKLLIKICFCLIISLALISFREVSAQTISPRLSVSPHTFELDVFRGETRTETIKISNKSKVALPILARTVDFTASDEEGGMAFDELSQDISFTARKWIKIENPNFILEPGEMEEVRFKIEVPENAEPGGHYAVMLFEPQLPSFYFEEGKPRAIPVIGVLFLFSVQIFTLEPEAHQKLEVVEFSVPGEERLIALENFTSNISSAIFRIFSGGTAQAAAKITITERSPRNFILQIKNNDIYHTKPFGKVVIYNIFGKKVGEAKIPQKTILPGKIRRFPIEFTPEIPEKLKWLPVSISEFLIQNLFIGKYQAKIELQAKSPLTAEILRPEIPVILTFFSLPWQFWLSFLSVFGMIIFLFVKYRRRIVLALKILVRKS